MSDMETPLRSGLQKIPVECRTCGVSESFYSNLSVDKFKVRHSGHDVSSGNEEPAPQQMVPEVTHAPKARREVSSEAGIKIAKVMVDVLNFASLGSPMVRIRGFDAALEEAFTATLLLEEGAKIKQMFETGSYLDRDASGLLYVWEPDVVEYVDDAKAKLEALGDAVAAEPTPESDESGVIDQAAVASATDIVMDAVREVEPDLVEAEPLPETPSPSPTVEEEFEVPAPPSLPQPAAALPVEPPTSSLLVPPRSAAKTTVTAALEDAALSTEQGGEDGYLLVSKSWYIQGGTGNRKEALRISKVLKAFRWKVEPVYTIGVILDDMLSIETSRSQISGTLIKRVESAGYKLTAVATDQGKPVAWFKRDGPETAITSREAGAEDSEMELEQDVTG